MKRGIGIDRNRSGIDDSNGDNTPIKEDPLHVVITSHKTFDGKGNPYGFINFLMEDQESKGTLKFFNLIGIFIQAIRENRLLVIDELDSSLHSVLTKAAIKLFNSDNGSTGQLLAASHDTALLDRDLLRRDQICFIEKDKFGASGLTTLSDYKIRKEAPYDRNYLEGRFGAIPFIKEFETILKHG